MSLPALAQSSGGYGAIASSKSHYRMEYGTASGAADAASATRAAIADCEMRLGIRNACEKHVAFHKRCAAVAEGGSDSGAAVPAATPEMAERLALAMCQVGNARQCKLVKSFCAG